MSCEASPILIFAEPWTEIRTNIAKPLLVSLWNWTPLRLGIAGREYWRGLLQYRDWWQLCWRPSLQSAVTAPPSSSSPARMTSAEITRRERKKIGGFEATFPNLVGMGGERERERDHGKEELPSDYASLWASSIQLFNVDGALKSRGKPAKTADPRPSMSVWWSTGQLRVVLNLSSDNTGKKKNFQQNLPIVKFPLVETFWLFLRIISSTKVDFWKKIWAELTWHLIKQTNWKSIWSYEETGLMEFV